MRCLGSFFAALRFTRCDERIGSWTRPASADRKQCRVPGTDYAIRLGTTHFREPNGAISQDLVAAIVTWLSAEFSLPIIEHQPVIKFVPAKEIVARRYNSILGPGRSAEDQNDTVAVYHDPTQTIYLAHNWNGSTPAKQSILVHEMVHHFQNLLRLRYECSQAREELAYHAQNRWLGLFGSNLATDFDIDGFFSSRRRSVSTESALPSLQTSV